jgi:hypothetical protein
MFHRGNKTCGKGCEGVNVVYSGQKEVEMLGDGSKKVFAVENGQK